MPEIEKITFLFLVFASSQMQSQLMKTKLKNKKDIKDNYTIVRIIFANIRIFKPKAPVPGIFHCVY